MPLYLFRSRGQSWGQSPDLSAAEPRSSWPCGRTPGRHSPTRSAPCQVTPAYLSPEPCGSLALLHVDAILSSVSLLAQGKCVLEECVLLGLQAAAAGGEVNLVNCKGEDIVCKALRVPSRSKKRPPVACRYSSAFVLWLWEQLAAVTGSLSVIPPPHARPRAP